MRISHRNALHQSFFILKGMEQLLCEAESSSLQGFDANF
jgi:hypothetical protein